MCVRVCVSGDLDEEECDEGDEDQGLPCVGEEDSSQDRRIPLTYIDEDQGLPCIGEEDSSQGRMIPLTDIVNILGHCLLRLH